MLPAHPRPWARAAAETRRWRRRGEFSEWQLSPALCALPGVGAAPWQGAARRRGFPLNHMEIFTHRLHGEEVLKKQTRKGNTRKPPEQKRLGCRELTARAAGEAGTGGGWVWLREMLRLCP